MVSRMIICVVIFAKSFLLLSTRGFSISSIPVRRASVTSRYAKHKNKGPQKPSRFAQDAHSFVPPKQEDFQFFPEKHDERRRRPPSRQASTRVMRRQTPEKSHPPQPKKIRFDSDDRSIEEVEATLIKRWGTDMKQWTANPLEDEFVFDDDDDDTSSGGSSKFRGKPVLDPWQKQEMATHAREMIKKERREQRQLFRAKEEGEERFLKRARQNQDALMRDPTRRASYAANEAIHSEKDDRQFKDNEKGIFRQDLPKKVDHCDDDDDDEVFELADDAISLEKNDFNLDNAARPQPKKRRETDGRTGANEPTTVKSPGFFFKPDVSKEMESLFGPAEGKEEEKPRNKKKKRQGVVPLLDEDGEPMLLTLAQATRFFEEAKGADTADDENSSSSVTSWEESGITSPRLLQTLKTMGCGTPLSVQEKCCPPVLTGNDVLVGTYTGSGKTLAFLVPLVQRLLSSPNSGSGAVKIMIIAPGRELASQTASVAKNLLEGTGLSVMLAIGGTAFLRNLEQIRKRKPTIIVGTPGRIAELVVGKPGDKRGRLKVSSLQSVVLDEFDALLEYKPHRDPTAAVISVLKRRFRNSLQLVLCSATASDMMGSKKLDDYLRPDHATVMADRDDKLVTTGNDSDSATRVSRTVIHGVVHVPHSRLALETVRRILHTQPIPQQILIFVENSRDVNDVVDKLARMDIIAAPLYGGDRSEKLDRAEVSKALREGFVGIVVATELAARGLDAPLLTHVINLNLPTDASHYAHRAGRCGRGGRPGVVINITTDPRERNVPKKFAEKLGVTMYTVEAKGAKLLLVDPTAEEPHPNLAP